MPGTGALGQGSVGRLCAGGDHVHLEVYAIDRDGLVLDIANAMSKAHVKIQSINARPINEGNCLTTLTLSVNSREHLENVVKILKKIPSVYHIERGAGR